MNFITNKFTDTDSLVYEIKTEDIYESFYESKKLLNFSDILKIYFAYFHKDIRNQ